jgi:uncharacterized lipoprotein YmbA
METDGAGGEMMVVRILAICTAIFLLVGCAQSEPSRLYTLNAFPGTSNGAGMGDLAVGVGPISLPQYLDRPQIVVRAGVNRLEVAEFDRWAEPLSEAVSRVIVENIGAALGTHHVYVLPRRRNPRIDFAVEIEFTRFEGSTDGKTVLVATWQVFSGGGDEPLLDNKTEVRKTVASVGDFDRVVASLSGALADLSNEIAKGIAQRLSKK